MKKLMFVLSIAALLVSCGGDSNVEKKDKKQDKKAKCDFVIKDLNLNGDVIKVRGEKKTDGAPLYLVKSSDGNIKKVDNIDSISPNDIKTMNVYKGNNGEQFKEYGNTTNGVILIELK